MRNFKKLTAEHSTKHGFSKHGVLCDYADCTAMKPTLYMGQVKPDTNLSPGFQSDLLISQSDQWSSYWGTPIPVVPLGHFWGSWDFFHCFTLLPWLKFDKHRALSFPIKSQSLHAGAKLDFAGALYNKKNTKLQIKTFFFFWKEPLPVRSLEALASPALDKSFSSCTCDPDLISSWKLKNFASLVIPSMSYVVNPSPPVVIPPLLSPLWLLISLQVTSSSLLSSELNFWRC